MDPQVVSNGLVLIVNAGLAYLGGTSILFSGLPPGLYFLFLAAISASSIIFILYPKIFRLRPILNFIIKISLNGGLIYLLMVVFSNLA
jgi:hypothetical protein